MHPIAGPILHDHTGGLRSYVKRDRSKYTDRKVGFSVIDNSGTSVSWLGSEMIPRMIKWSM